MENLRELTNAELSNFFMNTCDEYELGEALAEMIRRGTFCSFEINLLIRLQQLMSAGQRSDRSNAKSTRTH